MKKIGFIGTGNMGGALARAVAKAGFDVVLSDFFREKAETLAKEIGGVAADNATVVRECDYIFLGVKPQMLPALASEISGFLFARKSPFCLVSMAAGISLDVLAKHFGDRAVIRIMPNTPVSVGEGMILFAANKGGEPYRDGLREILSRAGRLDEIPEKLIDAASAISGCGPAFVCLFLEALADGGVRAGLPRDKALAYALATVRGTAALAMETGTHPAALKDAVCSPAGSTIEGVAALEDGGFRASVISAVTAAYEKTLKLGK